MSESERTSSDLLPVYDTIEPESEEYNTNQNSPSEINQKNESNNDEVDNLNDHDEYRDTNILELDQDSNIYWRRNNSNVRITII